MKETTDLTIPQNEAMVPNTPMQLLQLALQNEAGIEVIERLSALQERAMDREAEIDFNESMNRVQEKIKRIAPDLENSQTSSKYASYAAIDRRIRPIYSAEGFSLSFDTADCPKQDHVRVVCYVAKRGHVRRYQMDMSCDGKGPKGGAVMTQTHAEGAAMAYGMRYLVKGIFNIAIGQEDTDGNLTNGNLMTAEWLKEQTDEIGRCETIEGLMQAFKSASATALDNRDMNAYTILKNAKDKRKAEL